MHGSFGGGGFGQGPRGFGQGPRGFGPGQHGGMHGGMPGGVWEAMDQFRAAFEKRGGSRMGRGDVRQAVLALLAEQPMHGYQIIQEIVDRSGGAWKPSAGSVYPTLQLLADEGLITAEEAGGRKTYSLTEAGRAVAEESADRPAPWMGAGWGGGWMGGEQGPGHAALPKAGFDLAQAAAQVHRTGSPEQVQQAVSVLEDARRRLYSILAQD